MSAYPGPSTLPTLGPLSKVFFAQVAFGYLVGNLEAEGGWVSRFLFSVRISVCGGHVGRGRQSTESATASQMLGEKFLLVVVRKELASFGAIWLLHLVVAKTKVTPRNCDRALPGGAVPEARITRNRRL